MILTIHRGATEIGGSCIELVAADGTRILLDLGMPLTTPEGGHWPLGTAERPTRALVAEGVLPNVPGLYADEPLGVAAVVLSHAHLDHYGLAHHAHPDIPVYATKGTLALLDVSRIFVSHACLPANTQELPVGKPLRVGPFNITAIPVDHSAPDACALLVEADGRRVLYSGDLRAHGRTGYRFERLLSDPLRDIDTLLLEGTMVGSSDDGRFPTEAAVEQALVDLMAEHPEDLVAVVASGQTLDRLVSAYRAAKRTGRQLVLDPYQAYVLHRLAPLSDSIPQFSWARVRVRFMAAHVKRLREARHDQLVWEMARTAKVTTEEIAGQTGRFLLVVRSNRPTVKLLEMLPHPERTIVVWSMWRGYWDRDRWLSAFCERQGTEPVFVHSGGHARVEDLQRLAKAVRPRMVVPIHTGAAQAYAELFERVRPVENGVPVEF